MRLPWGPLDVIAAGFVSRHAFTILGCLSFEERSLRVPTIRCFAEEQLQSTLMVRVIAAPDAFPDNAAELEQRTNLHQETLARSVEFRQFDVPLLADEDDILEVYAGLAALIHTETVVLDQTCFPKRFFCFFLKQLMRTEAVRNIVVTYTNAGSGGYTPGHLSHDSMTSDHLPGFAPLLSKANVLAIGVGYEPLNLAEVVELYGRKQRPKLLFSFPANGVSTRRQWNTVRQIVDGDASAINLSDIEVVAAWDAELAYRKLLKWHSDSQGLTLAPFGAKPHTLAMTLFAIKHRAALF
jgi:hypothetical protein